MRLLFIVGLSWGCVTSNQLQPLGDNKYFYKHVDLAQCNGFSSETKCINNTRHAIYNKAETLCGEDFEVEGCSKQASGVDIVHVECIIHCINSH